MLSGESKDWTSANLQRESNEGCPDRSRDRPEDLTTGGGFPQVVHSAPPVLARSDALTHTTDLQDQQLLPDIPGAHFLAWKVPPSLRKNTLKGSKQQGPTSHAHGKTASRDGLQRFHVASPMHDPERKQRWMRATTDLGCTSLPMKQGPRPRILTYPCPQADNIKQALERYRSQQRDPLLSIQRRPPTMSALPQSLRGTTDRHCKTFCQIGTKDGHQATHPARGIPILSAPTAVYYNTCHRSSHFVIHPEWHMEP